MRNRGTDDSSNTWWIFVCLSISYFLFRWNLIYSVTMATPCRTISSYWLGTGHYLPNIFTLYVLIFLLFAGWSATEMLCAISANKSDKLVAVTVNPLILLFLGFLFYGINKQWEYFELQRDVALYGEAFTRPPGSDRQPE
ncbi:hypothetical protein [Microbulbifer sp. SAOS-129_SWC]|uniref:hypothetical protein n=1 Tax=Microbulbifer sp. SAOS-129_SWC TaxID=3145235 RepID=UPI00321809AC